MLRWSGQNANQKVGPDKMPTTGKKARTKCQPRLAFCPVGILSGWHFVHTPLNGYSSTLRSTLKATQKPYVLPSTCIFDLYLILFDQVYLPPSIAFHSDNIDNLCKINTIVHTTCDLAEYILVHNCTLCSAQYFCVLWILELYR